MKYSIKDNGLFYVKDSGNSISLVFNKSNQTSFYINNTAKYIYNICKYYESTEDIVKHLKEKYRNVDEKILERDVKDFFSILSIYGVIEYEESTIDSLDKGVLIVGDNEYFEVEKFLKNNFEKKEFSFITANNVKYFSTKEKAEEYVLMNKPCLSINDISDCLTFHMLGNNKVIHGSATLSTLKDLVKSKNK